MAVRDHLALALDLDDLVEATRLARQLRPCFGVAKVGLELFSAAGPEAVGAMRDLGYDVFLDLKLHDIPTTVGKSARVLGALGVSYLTLHSSGGAPMLQAGVEGLMSGAEAAGLAVPKAIGVTVLTSDADAPPEVLIGRIAAVVEAGCQGFVCSALDVHLAKELAPRLFAIVPGTRPAGADTHDQARVTTLERALADGADLLVIGRIVTHAPDPRAAAERLVSGLLADSVVADL